MIYPITVFGDSILRKTAAPITKEFPNLKEFIEDMFETMYHTDGVGLAAPQVGIAIRVFVIDSNIEPDEDEENEETTKEIGIKKVFINAEIIERKGDEWVMNEGCLSLPDIREDVSRPETIVIRYLDENFNEYTEEYSGMTSRIIQHEYDHLEGTLFVDHLSNIRKKILKNRLTAISKGKVTTKYKIKVSDK